MVIIFPNFCRAISMDFFFLKDRHSSEQADLRKREVGEKYSLGKDEKVEATTAGRQVDYPVYEISG